MLIGRRCNMKECSFIGCTELIKKGSRCEAHNRHREYQKYRGDNTSQQFYQSPQWRSIRGKALHRDRGLCMSCLDSGWIKGAYTVHHIEPIKVAWHRRLELGNLVSLCESCHQAEHKNQIK